jgi:hypothetical protein
MLAGCGGGGNDYSPGNIVAKNVTLSGCAGESLGHDAGGRHRRVHLQPRHRRVTGSVSTFGLTGLVAHIHTGASGVNGPIIIPLTPGARGQSGARPAGATLTEAQIASLRRASST